jgi:hypothetical protein
MRPASRDQVVATIREFYDQHGRLPFKHEWEHADGERPTRRTIERRWGWEKLLAEAIDVEPDDVEDAFKSEDRYVALVDSIGAYHGPSPSTTTSPHPSPALGEADYGAPLTAGPTDRYVAADDPGR